MEGASRSTCRGGSAPHGFRRAKRLEDGGVGVFVGIFRECATQCSILVGYAAHLGRTYPKIPSPILVDGSDAAAGQTTWILRIMPVMDESFGSRFQTVQPEAGTNPQVATAIPINTIHIVID